MKSRAEAADFAKKQLTEVSESPWHYGRTHLKRLLDFIYEEDGDTIKDSFFMRVSNPTHKRDLSQLYPKIRSEDFEEDR